MIWNSGFDCHFRVEIVGPEAIGYSRVALVEGLNDWSKAFIAKNGKYITLLQTDLLTKEEPRPNFITRKARNTPD
jgi:hypothetical protein